MSKSERLPNRTIKDTIKECEGIHTRSLLNSRKTVTCELAITRRLIGIALLHRKILSYVTLVSIGKFLFSDLRNTPFHHVCAVEFTHADAKFSHDLNYEKVKIVTNCRRDVPMGMLSYVCI